MKNKLLDRFPLHQSALRGLTCALVITALQAPAQVHAKESGELLAPPVQSQPSQQALPIPNHLFTLSHPVGQQRLQESSYRQAYYPLATYYETQRNQAYCSVATSVIALNALGLPRPATTLYPDFPFFTQDNFFAGVSPHIAQPETVAKEGMTLDQLSAVLAHHPVKVEKISASTLDIDTLRALLQQHLRESDRFVLLNFNRRLIGQVGGGHWSPLAAYHAASDSALLMDVARYKYPPVWIPLPELLAAAQDPDSVSSKSRGLVVISATH